MGPDPILVPQMWDLAIIAGVTTPGIASIESADGLKLKWDEKKGYGTSGQTSTFTGRDISKFTLKLTFAEGVNGQSSFAQRVAFFDEIIPLLEAGFEGKQAIDFYHCAVSEPPFNIRAVDIEHIHPLKRDHESGIWSISIDFRRFARPKPGLGTPKGAKQKNSKKAVDEADLEIANLNATLKSLENI